MIDLYILNFEFYLNEQKSKTCDQVINWSDPTSLRSMKLSFVMCDFAVPLEVLRFTTWTKLHRTGPDRRLCFEFECLKFELIYYRL